MPEYAAMLVIIAGVAMIMDLRTTCVDNGWILLSLGAGIVLRLSREGLAGLAYFLPGVLIPMLLLGWLFFFRMLGAGDIKLFCTLGGLMGPAAVCRCVLVSFLLGAILSLAILTVCGGFGSRFRYLFSYLRELRQSGEVKPYCQKEMSFEKFHFTVPVFLSVMLYVGGVY